MTEYNRGVGRLDVWVDYLAGIDDVRVRNLVEKNQEEQSLLRQPTCIMSHDMTKPTN